jgi:hypothetical protein
MVDLRSMRRLLLLLVAAFAAACGKSEDTTGPPVTAAYRQAVEMICDAPARSGASAGDPVLGEWLTMNIQDPDAQNLLRAIVTAAREDKARLLRAEARRAGLVRCPFADQIQTRVETTPAPAPPP